MGDGGCIVGFCGLAGSGKSTAAKRLEAHGYLRLPFAGPLKDMLRTLMRTQGASEAEIAAAIDGAEKEKPSVYLAGETPRRAMQTLGTEWGRALAPGLWTSAWRLSLPCASRIVVDDVRYPNEVAAIRSLGGGVWRIERPGAGLAGAAADHTSEGQALDVDGTIDNGRSIGELEAAVDRLLTTRAWFWPFTPRVSG